MPLLAQAEAFQQALASWYATARRPLPWRTEPSLYRTVVSEFMLQQTQVKTMLPYYARWLARFPDFETLASAAPEDVLKHWEGLGYYSRARNFHKLAQTYVTLEAKPTTAPQWRELPGIGPYTSAAISSIAQDFPAAVVDGNVVRILARLTHDTRCFKNNGEAVKAFNPTAQAILNPTTPGEHNQAMMELGATVCLKRKPHCTTCPVTQFCQSAAQGSPEAIPRIQRKATERIEIDRLWIVKNARLLLHRVPEHAPQLAGQYELPATEHFKEKFTLPKPLLSKTRSITHRRILERIHSIDPSAAQRNTLTPQTELIWIEISQLDHITLSGPHRRWVNELLNL